MNRISAAPVLALAIGELPGSGIAGVEACEQPAGVLEVLAHERALDGAIGGLRADVSGDRSHGQHIEVDKYRVGFEFKVLIGNVAAADHADRMVYRERLVVHAAVGAPEIANKIQETDAAP